MECYCIAHSGRKCLEKTGFDQSKEASLLRASLRRALGLCESPGEGVGCGIFQTTGSRVLSVRA